MPDAPRPSPQPDIDRPGELSGEPKTDPSLHAALRRHDNKLTLRSVVVAIAAVALGVTSALMFLDNRVAAQTDAGVKVHEQRIITLEQNAKEDREKTAHDMKRVNKKVDRLEDKIDLLLDKANVPKSKRPAKDDDEP